ncbi:MAG: TIGR04255 family protein [Chloroflexi bacterium]|nr:TIGR04255 family protein [Chloroflexota bacterium]
MGRRYRNPPVVEALCEFRFKPGQPWDLAIPGLVYEKIRDRFPKRRQARIVELSVTATPDGVGQQVLTADRMQFLREDEKALVQVDRDLLAVNHLKPYPTWREFLPLIQQGFSAYRDVARPEGFQRIGLRYINRIEIPGQRVDLEHYLEFRPFVGPNLPQDYGPFMVGIEVPYQNGRDRLRLQVATAAIEKPDALAVMLDLDYFLAEPGQVQLDDVLTWIDAAHSRVEEVFEACLTDRLRQMFEETPEQ